jgi:hypothetical protein
MRSIADFEWSFFVVGLNPGFSILSVSVSEPMDQARSLSVLRLLFVSDAPIENRPRCERKRPSAFHEPSVFASP